jgi:tetratricopeptide (TPR) repeat protein
MKGIKFFQLAADLDPEYALAHTGLADALLLAASYGLIYPKDAGEMAKEAAETAIKLNPLLSEPYSSMGFYYTCFAWDWNMADKFFQKSFEINPYYAQAHYWYGLDYLTWAVGDFEKAERHARIAIDLEPLSSICYGMYAPILHAQKKFHETIAICKKGIELDPYAFTCNIYEGLANTFLGNYRNGLEIFEKFMVLSNKHPFAAGALCITYCLMGETGKAKLIYDDLVERSKTTYITYTMIGVSAGHLGYIDEALKYFEMGRDAREPIVLSLRVESWVPQVLKQDKRFQQFIRQFNFPV